jgi:hypothetical protein
VFILPHFLAYSKYYFCPGVGLQDLGASQLTKKYSIGGIGGQYLPICTSRFNGIILLRISCLMQKGALGPFFIGLVCFLDQERRTPGLSLPYHFLL